MSSWMQIAKPLSVRFMKCVCSLLIGWIVFPTASVLAQDLATDFGDVLPKNEYGGIRFVTANWNWSQSFSESIGPGPHSFPLKPCPPGIDTSADSHYSYKVYISGGTGTPETAPVTGGKCPSGSASGFITVTISTVHTGPYTVGSASTGIQEAWNDAWANDLGADPNESSLTAPYVKLVSNTLYRVYAPVYMRGRGGILDGAGALIVCSTRDRCIYVGTTGANPNTTYHHLYNLSGTSTVQVNGAQVGNVSASIGTYTITTAESHPFVAGDTVDCEYHSQHADQHWVSTVLSGGLKSTQFEVHFGSNTFAPGTGTFGFCNLLNAFIEDNSDHVIIQDLSLMQAFPSGKGQFSYGVVNDNDQQLHIVRATNRASGSINDFESTWPIGAYVYQRSDQGMAGITYLIDSEFTNINCATGGGNGLVVRDTVCQSYPMFGFRYFGGLQPATFDSLYQEAAPSTFNPLYKGKYAAQMGYLVQSSAPIRVVGTWPTQSLAPQFANSGSTIINYFVVPRSSNFGYGPVLFIGSARASGRGEITLQWPSVDLVNDRGQDAGTLTWDVVKTVGQNTPAPNASSGGTLVARSISGSCSTSGICSGVDSQTSSVVYKVQTQQFIPKFWWWPANYAINNSILQLDRVSTQEPLVASQGILGVGVIALMCDSGEFGVTQQRSPADVECLMSSSVSPGEVGTVLRQIDAGNNGPGANDKGRLNFGAPITPPNDIITLIDSNVAKTQSTFGERPPNDVGDIALGVDQVGGMSLRAPKSISSYVNVTPNGTNYLERLMATGKTFNVPVTVGGHLNQSAVGNFAGTCSMSSATTCTITLLSPYENPICIVTSQGPSAGGGVMCSVNSKTVTITTTTPSSNTWGAIIIGNPH